MLYLSTAEALARARQLVAPDHRVLLGITGAPGAGKSTLAAWIGEALGQQAVVVAMDGFHLAQAELVRLGRAERKGAPDTFDAGGYVAMLRRLRQADEPVVYAPVFRRDLEEPIGSAVAVHRDVSLVVTEGNYLLLDGWEPVAELLDECWFVEVDEVVRVDRLVARHVAHGKTPEAARAWAMGSDQQNAKRIAATRDRATAIVRS